MSKRGAKRKLSWWQTIKIRWGFKKYAGWELAEQYGVSTPTIYKVVHRRYYGTR